MSYAAVQSHTLLDESLRSLPIPLFESVGHPGPIKLKLPCTDMSLLHPTNKQRERERERDYNALASQQV